ncbi:hypothetical protein ABZP36_013286 [Zizania latifolia]
MGSDRSTPELTQIPDVHSGINNRAASPVYGNFGPQITNSVVGSNTGRIISSTGLSMPRFASPMNLRANTVGGMLQQASPLNMLGSSYPAPGGRLYMNHLQAGNSSFGSSGMRHDGNSGENSLFDINDFPQLVGRSNSAGSVQGQYGSLPKQGVSANAIVQQNQEFRIQNEDFPALPVFKGTNLHHRDHLPKNMGKSSGFNSGGSYPPLQQHKQIANSVQNTGLENIGPRPVNSPIPHFNSRTQEQLMQQNSELQAQNSFRVQSSSGPQSQKDQSLNSFQETESTDTASRQYGLLGLVSAMNLKEDDPAASLSLGIDLATLGLDMNSSDPLYKTFGSPWSNEPYKGEADYQIPACYSLEQPPTLQPLHFKKFSLPVLFYIFYSMPRDVAQLHAAKELYNKGWFYHKEQRLWLTRIPNEPPLVKTANYEQGSYIYMDENTLAATRKDNFILHYDAIEKIPALPALPSATPNGSERQNKDIHAVLGGKAPAMTDICGSSSGGAGKIRSS